MHQPSHARDTCRASSTRCSFKAHLHLLTVEPHVRALSVKEGKLLHLIMEIHKTLPTSESITAGAVGATNQTRGNQQHQKSQAI